MPGRERPKLRYRLTWMLNVLVWKLPLPRRLLVRLSSIVYRNPPVPADHVADVVELLEVNGVRVFCTGGWGVDVLLGRQTRTHRDLDLIVDESDFAHAEELLAGIGYEEWYRHDSDAPLHSYRVVRDHQARVLDLHPVDLESYRLRFASGTVDGRPAPCLSAVVQEAQHTGYRKRHRDRLDLRRLRRVLLGPATALIIPVPDADAILDDRAKRDHGMPAHVTVVAPFLSGEQIDAPTEDELADAIASIPAFDFTLGDDGVRADEVWLMTRDGERWICRARFPLGAPETVRGGATAPVRPPNVREAPV